MELTKRRQMTAGEEGARLKSNASSETDGARCGERRLDRRHCECCSAFKWSLTCFSLLLSPPQTLPRRRSSAAG